MHVRALWVWSTLLYTHCLIAFHYYQKHAIINIYNELLYATSSFVKQKTLPASMGLFHGLLQELFNDTSLLVSLVSFYDFVECITSGNIALYVNDNHIMFYHMNAFRSIC